MKPAYAYFYLGMSKSERMNEKPMRLCPILHIGQSGNAQKIMLTWEMYIPLP